MDQDNSDNELHINILIQDFLDNLDRADSTRMLYKRTLGYFSNWLGRNPKPFLDRKTEDVINYKKFLLEERKLSVLTVDNYVDSIRTFYKYLTGLDPKYVNITKGIRKLRDKHSLFLKAHLDMDQLNQLINSIKGESITDKRNLAIVKLLAYTGTRPIELSRLDYGDLTCISGKYYLQIQRKGKRQKGGIIPATDLILKPLNNYLKSRDDNPGEKSPMFINHSYNGRGKRLAPITISKQVKAYLINIGLTGHRYSCHSLRHTAASLARISGSNIHEIQYMMGHANEEQTEHYLESIGMELSKLGTAVLNISEFERKHHENGKRQNLSALL
jgi:integrase